MPAFTNISGDDLNVSLDGDWRLVKAGAVLQVTDDEAAGFDGQHDKWRPEGQPAPAPVETRAPAAEPAAEPQQ